MSAELEPTATGLSAPYWEAARRHALVLQRCACRRYLFHPRANCPSCGSEQLTWEEVCGRGVVYSYTVARRPTHPVFADLVPMVIAIVELTEGPRLTTNTVGCEASDVSIGMPVTVDYLDNADVTLPVFRPALP